MRLSKIGSAIGVGMNWHHPYDRLHNSMTTLQISLLLKFLNRVIPKGREEERELLWIINALQRANGS